MATVAVTAIRIPTSFNPEPGLPQGPTTKLGAGNGPKVKERSNK